MALEEQLRNALADKDLLIREVDHRVKNSLSVITAMLSLQQGTGSSEETRAAIRTAAQRVMAVARIHERLYRASQLDVVDFGSFLNALCDDLAATIDGSQITIERAIDSVEISVDQAVPLGLVANELVTNACKHAGVAGGVTISLTLVRNSATAALRITDTGPGMPVSFDGKSRKGLGMQVVEALAAQAKGRIAMPKGGEAASFEVAFPITQSGIA